MQGSGRSGQRAVGPKKIEKMQEGKEEGDEEKTEVE